MRRMVYGQCAGLLAVGSANRDYYRALGIPDSRISLVPYTVDNDRIIAESTVSPADRQAIRARLGVTDDAPVILYASKFQRRKRPDDLVAAFLKIRAQGFQGHLVMVGSGEMDAELRAQAAAAGDANIHFPGFMNQTQLPPLFAASEILALPSKAEPWGFIVNEAMCAGLPVVVTDEVGCVPDLVRPGINGETFRARDVDGLAAALMRIGSDAGLRKKMGAASRAIIDHWSYRECLTGVREAMAKAGITGRAS
jgi:glycosyltransferase involved in cell wall biosynthesis